MEFIDENIENYALLYSSTETPLLQKLNRETQAEVLQPRMLSGHLQGRTLSLISKLLKPKFILEIGTYTGYSALCLAEGLQKDGELHSIDINEEIQSRAQGYFNASPFRNQIKLHIGHASDLIPKLKMDFDLIFIDADKENYIKYYQLLIDQLKSGSIIIADNVLWSGKVLKEYEQLDSETKTLVDYSQMIQEDSRVENVLLPIRDGLMVARVL